MNLSVITVTWNSKELIGQQIESVRKGCKNISFEQIIADNNSPDGTADFIEKEFKATVILSEAKDPLNPSKRDSSAVPQNDNVIKLLRYDKNTGFGFPNNAAAKMSSGEFLLFLNPDMQVAEGSLDIILDWMKKNKEVGLASCKLVDENGKLHLDAQPRHFPKITDQLAIIFKIPHIFPHILDHYMFTNFNAEKEQEVESVRGSFMLMRREVYEKLGWAFDHRYFIWFEDVDTCREVKRLGYKVMHTPIITCVDYIGQSFKQRTTLWKQKNFTKSMLQYFQKWEPWYKWIWIWLARPIGIGMAWVNDKIHK